MRKAGCAIVMAAAVGIGAGEAAAQKIEKPKVFVGGSVGLSIGSDRADFVERTMSDATAGGDRSVSALGAFAGVEYKGLAGELGYLKMGDLEIEITPNRGGEPGRTVTVARDVLFLTMSHELPWKSQKGIKVATNVKAGLAKWGSKSSIGNLSGLSLIAGLNATLKVNKRIDLRADLLYLPAGDRGQSDQQVILLLALSYDFEI